MAFTRFCLIARWLILGRSVKSSCRVLKRFLVRPFTPTKNGEIRTFLFSGKRRKVALMKSHSLQSLSVLRFSQVIRCFSDVVAKSWDMFITTNGHENNSNVETSCNKRQDESEFFKEYSNIFPNILFGPVCKENFSKDLPSPHKTERTLAVNHKRGRTSSTTDRVCRIDRNSIISPATRGKQQQGAHAHLGERCELIQTVHVAKHLQTDRRHQSQNAQCERDQEPDFLCWSKYLAIYNNTYVFYAQKKRFYVSQHYLMSGSGSRDNLRNGKIGITHCWLLK